MTRVRGQKHGIERPSRCTVALTRTGRPCSSTVTENGRDRLALMADKGRTRSKIRADNSEADQVLMDTSAKLEAHERECAIRYQSFQDKLDHIDKRLWRLEALMMASTLTIVAQPWGCL